MNERYRWDENHERNRATERDASARGDRANHSWDGREPYPKDLGGLNRPREDRAFAVDPVTGDRGSAGGGPAENRDVQFGDEPVRQRGRPASAHQARQPSGDGGRYLEGGYEARPRLGDEPVEARGWWDRASDEVRAWMGDREARGRLQRDEAEHERYGRRGGDWHGHDDDTGWRDPISDADARPAEASPREHRPGLFRDDAGRS